MKINTNDDNFKVNLNIEEQPNINKNEEEKINVKDNNILKNINLNTSDKLLALSILSHFVIQSIKK